MEETTVSASLEQEQTSDCFMEGWEDDAFVSESEDHPESQTEGGEVNAGEGSEAAQSMDGAPEAARTAEQDGKGEAEADNDHAGQKEHTDGPKTWTLRHMGENRTVEEAEMITYAQKGLDYDRIREKYDESKPVMELMGTFAKEAGMSLRDYVGYIRTQAKKASGMNEHEARRAVELEDREAAVKAGEDQEAQRRAALDREAAAKQAAEERRRADIAEFQRAFPDAAKAAAKDPKAIPQEVWEAVRGGSSLVAAYARYAVKQAQNAQKAAESKANTESRNKTNAERSTGSMRGAG